MKSLRLKNEKGPKEHRSKGTKNDEGQSGTICSANNGTSSHIDYKGTIDDISTRETIEGRDGGEEGSTKEDISIGEEVEGSKVRS